MTKKVQVSLNTIVSPEQIIKLLSQVFADEFITSVIFPHVATTEVRFIFEHITSSIVDEEKIKSKLAPIFFDRVTKGKLFLDEEERELDIDSLVKSIEEEDDDDDRDDDYISVYAGGRNLNGFGSSINEAEMENKKVLASLSKSEKDEVLRLANKAKKKANKKIKEYIDSLAMSPDEDIEGICA